MNVVVDRDLCEAHGVCVRLAPDLFQFDEQVQRIVRLARPSKEREQAAQAVRYCPKAALSLHSPKDAV